MSLGLEHGINRLAPYSPDWPSRFTVESKKLSDVCGKYILAIEHVGSTSIPGMLAKPIVDILIGVEALNNAEKMIPGMESIGYDYPGDIGIPDDRIFGRDPGFRKYLVHVVVINSTRWTRYIDFRDALRQDVKLADEYCELKTAIVRKHPEGRAKYTELKSDFINRVLEQWR
jgi:GrpB-like predicted nucleotidyltransferase (UPF0157 family)